MPIHRATPGARWCRIFSHSPPQGQILEISGDLHVVTCLTVRFADFSAEDTLSVKFDAHPLPRNYIK
jgi:hypothetical protein